MSSDELAHAGINLKASDPLTREEAELGVFGFWVFLMADAVLFALLFATYGVMQPGTAGAPGPGELYELKSAFIETIVLLTSSFTFGMASFSMKYEHGPKTTISWLAVTCILGLAFISLELRDFITMFGEGGYPDRSGFLSSFFVLVPCHGLHVFSGCVWMLVMIVQILVFGFDARVKLNVLRLGLFWHFLDVIWVIIFSVVYLQGKIT